MADKTTEQTTDETTNAPAVDEDQEESAEQEAPAGDEPEETERDGSKAAREAAKYRRQLRETQAERDQLREQIDAMRRAEVERLAGAVLRKPAGLWASGVQVTDLLAEDGMVDRDKVVAAAKQAAESLGLARPMRNYVPNEGRTAPAGGNRSMVDTVMGRDG